MYVFFVVEDGRFWGIYWFNNGRNEIYYVIVINGDIIICGVMSCG